MEGLIIEENLMLMQSIINTMREMPSYLLKKPGAFVSGFLQQINSKNMSCLFYIDTVPNVTSNVPFVIGTVAPSEDLIAVPLNVPFIPLAE
jgi:hypothetical protein